MIVDAVLDHGLVHRRPTGRGKQDSNDRDLKRQLEGLGDDVKIWLAPARSIGTPMAAWAKLTFSVT